MKRKKEPVIDQPRPGFETPVTAQMPTRQNVERLLRILLDEVNSYGYTDEIRDLHEQLNEMDKKHQAALHKNPEYAKTSKRLKEINQTRERGKQVLRAKIEEARRYFYANGVTKQTTKILNDLIATANRYGL